MQFLDGVALVLVSCDNKSRPVLFRTQFVVARASLQMVRTGPFVIDGSIAFGGFHTIIGF
jgi:hypothetical protein